MKKKNFYAPLFFVYVILLSSCSTNESRLSKRDNLPGDQQAIEKIQHLILNCVLPEAYYRWSDDKSVHLDWFTTEMSIEVNTSWDENIKKCVEQNYAAQPFTFRSGLFGKLDISNR
ncbi:hypothetical protein [Pantoea cypripedii]|jgi:hypothetical protein|uniref:hypothetical protein n=1 Tax=Pantoea cypripedii TaxID=55209 RepID=UPI001ABF4AE6|nr:hypothetical protein [Pantoea cypripedii]